MSWVALDLTDAPQNLVVAGTYDFDVVTADIGQSHGGAMAVRLCLRVRDTVFEGHEIRPIYVLERYNRARLRRLLEALEVPFTATGFEADQLAGRALRAYAYNHEARYWTIKDEAPMQGYATWTIAQLEAEVARLQQRAEDTMEEATRVADRAVMLRTTLHTKQLQAVKDAKK